MMPASPAIEFVAAALAFLLLANRIVRDLDECGLQILLLLFLSLAAWSFYHGARIQSGAWLGLAITFELTPVLFIPLLLWKRRFAEAAAIICFVIVFNVIMPGLIWGPNLTREFLARHIQVLETVATLDDLFENGIERPSHRSQSLKLAIARYLQNYPPGHPLFIQFLSLPKATAKRIAAFVIFFIGLIVGWRLRQHWLLLQAKTHTDSLSSLAPEWAIACAFAAILSPLTWHLHLTLVLPRGYLVIRDALIRSDQSRIRWAGFAFIFASI